MMQRAEALTVWKLPGDVRVALGGAMLMFALGFLYAWSIFVLPIEEALRSGRAMTGAIFSLATFSFAIGMYFVPKLLRRLSYVQAVCAVGIAGLVGHLVSALLTGPAVLLGYGLLFGLANGAGYGVAVQAVQLACGRWRGRATGAIVACYALGAATIAPLLEVSLPAVGLGPTFVLQGGGFVLLVLLSALLIAVVDVGHAASRSVPPGGIEHFSIFALLWISLFGATCAGVFALGHAAVIVEPACGSGNVASAAASIAIGNLVGRLFGGWSGEGRAAHWWVAALQFAAAAAFLALLFVPGCATGNAAVALSGLGYGWMAGAMPVMVGRLWGVHLVGFIYGRLFTAWGAAALIAPWLGGALFEFYGSYAPALATACATAVLSGLAAAGTTILRRDRPPVIPD